MKTIEGSSPRTFPAGGEQNRDTLIRVYGASYHEGREFIVPDGQVLIVPEHRGGCDSLPETRHEFSAGTRFRVVRCGTPYVSSVTRIL